MMKTDILSKEKIHTLLPEAVRDLPVFLFDCLDSTNNEAKKMITKDGLKQGLIIADYQTAGRGRIGHTFFSPKGSGIYLSYVFTPENLDDAFRLTTKASVCVLEAIEELYGVNPLIKWVNDIYLDGKKICGILSEAVTDGVNKGTLVCGIGINFSNADYPEEIKEIAGALPLKEGITRNNLIASIIGRLEKEARNLSSTEYIKKYRQASMLTGTDITYYENEVLCKAHVLDIDEDAGLVVELPGKTIKTLKNGEVFTVRKV